MQWTNDYIIPLTILLEKEITHQKGTSFYSEEHSLINVFRIICCFRGILTCNCNTHFRQKEAF